MRHQATGCSPRRLVGLRILLRTCFQFADLRLTFCWAPVLFKISMQCLSAQQRTWTRETDGRNVCIVCLEHTGIYFCHTSQRATAETEMVLWRVVVDKDFVKWSSKNVDVIATDEAEKFFRWSFKTFVVITIDETDKFLRWSSENLVVVATIEEEGFRRPILFGKKFWLILMIILISQLSRFRSMKNSVYI